MSHRCEPRRKLLLLVNETLGPPCSGLGQKPAHPLPLEVPETEPGTLPQVRQCFDHCAIALPPKPLEAKINLLVHLGRCC